MPQLIKVAEIKDIPAGQGKGVEAGGKKIAIFNVDGKYFAIGDTCTHRGASLCEGLLDGAKVICPWHGAAFDLATGQAMSPPARIAVSCYKVEVDGSDIRVEVP